MEIQTADTPRKRLRRRLRQDKGAVGTEMAIVVAIVVGIALALGVVMTAAATSNSACIPATPSAQVPANC